MTTTTRWMRLLLGSAVAAALAAPVAHGPAEAANSTGAGAWLRPTTLNAAEDDCDFQMRFGRRWMEEPTLGMLPVQLRLDCDAPLMDLRVALNGKPLLADLSVRRGVALLTTAAPVRAGEPAATLCLTFGLAADGQMETVERCTTLPALTVPAPAEPTAPVPQREQPGSTRRAAPPAAATDGRPAKAADAPATDPRPAPLVPFPNNNSNTREAPDRTAKDSSPVPLVPSSAAPAGGAVAPSAASAAGADDQDAIPTQRPSRRVGGIEVLDSAGGPLESVNGTLKRSQPSGAGDEDASRAAATELKLPPNHHWALPSGPVDVDNAIVRGLRQAMSAPRSVEPRGETPSARPSSSNDTVASAVKTAAHKVEAAEPAVKAPVPAALSRTASVPAAAAIAVAAIPVPAALSQASNTSISVGPTLEPAPAAMPRTLVKAGDAGTVPALSAGALGAALALAGWRLRGAGMPR